MSPTSTYRMMVASFSAGDFEDADDAALNLMNWLRKGGFPPKGMTIREAYNAAREVRAECREELAVR